MLASANSYGNRQAPKFLSGSRIVTRSVKFGDKIIPSESGASSSQVPVSAESASSENTSFFDFFGLNVLALCSPDILLQIIIIGSTLILVLPHPYRDILFIRFFLLQGVLFFLRSISIFITLLPPPQEQCLINHPAHDESFIWQGILTMFRLRVTCCDVLYSGHTVNMSLFLMGWHQFWWDGENPIVFCKNSRKAKTTKAMISVDSPKNTLPHCSHHTIANRVDIDVKANSQNHSGSSTDKVVVDALSDALPLADSIAFHGSKTPDSDDGLINRSTGGILNVNLPDALDSDHIAALNPTTTSTSINLSESDANLSPGDLTRPQQQTLESLGIAAGVPIYSNRWISRQLRAHLCTMVSGLFQTLVFLGYLSMVASQFHYSIDVFLGGLLTYMLWNHYMSNVQRISRSILTNKSEPDSLNIESATLSTSENFPMISNCDSDMIISSGRNGQIRDDTPTDSPGATEREARTLLPANDRERTYRVDTRTSELELKTIMQRWFIDHYSCDVLRQSLWAHPESVNVMESDELNPIGVWNSYNLAASESSNATNSISSSPNSYILPARIRRFRSQLFFCFSKFGVFINKVRVRFWRVILWLEIGEAVPLWRRADGRNWLGKGHATFGRIDRRRVNGRGQWKIVF